MNSQVVHDGKDSYTVNGMPHVRASMVFARQYFHDQNRTNLVCAELGVQRGDNAMRLHSVLQPSVLWLIDRWDSFQNTPSEDYSGGPANFEHVKSLFDPVPGVVLIRATSQDTLATVRTNFFDFIYIDADHRPGPCMEDIKQSLRVVKEGGIVAGHDYLSDASSGIKMLQGTEGDVALAVHTIFNGQFVYGETGDWWVIVTPALKALGASDD